MIKIKFNYRKTYTPATSINNPLSAGSSATITADTSYTNKIYSNDTGTLITYGSAGWNLTFTNCLFFKCNILVDSADYNVGVIKFVNCSFYQCSVIADTGTASTGSFIFERLIIRGCPYLNTALNVTFTNGKPSCIQKFYGVTGTITYNDTIFKNPCFIDETIDDLPDTNPDYDGTSFVLMSKSRGYLFDSPCCVEESGDSVDMGVWTETRAVGVDTNDEWIIDSFPQQTKGYQLLNFSSFQDVDGVARSYHNGTKKKVSLDFGDNGLTETDIVKYFAMLNSADNKIIIYPDSDDTARYVECRLLKDEGVDYAKHSGNYWDSQRIAAQRFSGCKIVATVESEVGTWI